MKWSKLSHVGLVRKTNEDNSCICDDIGLIAVADGMGGHRAGEIASKLALEALADNLRANPNIDADPGTALKTAFKHANITVFTYAQQKGTEFRGMGTTVTAALLRDNKVVVAHVGDSRAYIVRGSEIKLLTSDHSLVNELLKCGELTKEEARSHPKRNILTRAIGTSPEVEVDVVEEPVTKGDIIILCTDGLFNLVDLEEIRQLAGENRSLADRAKHLIEKALDRGGDDNITVVLYQI